MEVMEEGVPKRTCCAERRISSGANEASMKTSSPLLSTQAQQNRIMGNICAGLNSLLDCKLFQSLKESQLGRWLRDVCAGQWSEIALQLLKAGLFLLFVFLLAELHVVLPCLLLCGCLLNDPLIRAVNTALAWIIAPVGCRVVEQTLCDRSLENPDQELYSMKEK